MSKVIMINHLTLDGVVQAPGRADEDPRGDFAYGGWAQPGNDDIMAKVMMAQFPEGASLLLGRRTYQQLGEYWPTQPRQPVQHNVGKYPKVCGDADAERGTRVGLIDHAHHRPG